MFFTSNPIRFSSGRPCTGAWSKRAGEQPWRAGSVSDRSKRAGQREQQRRLPPPRSSAVRAAVREPRNRPLSGSARRRRGGRNGRENRQVSVAQAKAPGGSIFHIKVVKERGTVN